MFLRYLRNYPPYLVGIVSLTLGLGLTLTVATLVHALYYQPMLVEHANSIRVLWQPHRETPSHRQIWTAGDALAVRDALGESYYVSLVEFEPQKYRNSALAVVDGWPYRTLVASATPEWFELLGVTFARGSFAQTNASNEVVVSYEYWTRVLGRREDVIGQTLNLGEEAYTIVGVLARGFTARPGLRTIDVWLTAPWADAMSRERDRFAYTVFARPKGPLGTTLTAVLPQLAASLVQADPENKYRQLWAEPLRSYLLPEATKAKGLLVGAAAILLLATLFSVSALFSVPALDRSHETAVRKALGETRWFMIRRTLMEVSVLVAGGVLCAAFVSRYLIDYIVSYVKDAFGAIMLVPPPVTTIAATAFAAGTCVVLVATGYLVTLWRSTDLNDALRRADSRTTTSRFGFARALLLALVAAGVVSISVPAYMLSVTALALAEIPLGYDADGLVALQLRLDLPEFRNGAARQAYIRLLHDKLDSSFGGGRGAVSSSLPFFGSDWLYVASTPGGDPSTQGVFLRGRAVTPGYFDVVGTRIQKGRDFSIDDRYGGEQVVALSESAAGVFFPGAEALGRRLVVGAPDSAASLVIAIVEDAHFSDVTKPPEPAIYVPREQVSGELVTAYVRVAPAAVEMGVERLRAVVKELSPLLPVEWAGPVKKLVDREMTERRLLLSLLLTTALVTMIVAYASVYGVTAQVMRTLRKKAVIMELLGGNRHVVRLMCAQPVVLGVCAGLVLGVLPALVVGSVIRPLLFGIQVSDLHGWVVPMGCAAIAVLGAVGHAVGRAEQDSIAAILQRA